jgi:hypothetical protein
MDYDVLEACHVRDFVVWLRFRDGTEGEVDLQPELWGEVFEPLRDPEYFKQFTIDPRFYTLAWPNDVDIAPEFLHEAARPSARRFDPASVKVVTAIPTASGTMPGVPELSRFLGIVISMYHREHGAPHFHARYGGHRISIEVQSGTVHGSFPPRALRLVHEWAEMHRADLLSNWELARRQKPLVAIPPLE